MDAGDDELMLRTQKGNVHAFELLFERYRARVFGFILRMLNGQQQEAEDLMQDIFIKVYNAREMYEPKAMFSTWLFAIARNHCLNFVRSKAYLQAQRTVPLAPEDASGIALTADHTCGADGKQGADLTERLERAICSLPNIYKDVFLLRAVDGFSHDETARILGLNPATVRTHFRRARLMLVEKLEGTIDPACGNAHPPQTG